MQVRLADQRDADALSRLMGELGYDASSELIQAKLHALGAHDADRVIVAESDGVVAGVVSCHVIPLFHQTGCLGRITSFVVGDGFRGAGVGRKLLEAAERFFQDSGCVRAEVSSGDQRLAAHEFYRACGFEEAERRFIKAYF